MTSDETFVVFQSASTAGVVYIELGFVPSFVRMTTDLFGTAKQYLWANNAQFPLWPVANTVLMQGGTVVTAVDTTTAIAVYPGGELISSTENANSAPKHVNRQGTAATQGHITSPGIVITAASQVNSGFVLVEATRNDQ